MRDFNFFSPYIEVKKSSRFKLIYIIATAGLVVFIIAGTTAFNLVRINRLNKEIAGLKHYVTSESTVKQLKDYDALKAQVETMNKYYAKLERINGILLGRNMVSSSLLSEISDTVPQDVFIKSVTVDNENIQLECISKSREAVAEMEHNLKGMEAMSEVHVAVIENLYDNNTGFYDFIINCKTKDVNNK